jgi:hypothetical protein
MTGAYVWGRVEECGGKPIWDLIGALETQGTDFNQVLDISQASADASRTRAPSYAQRTGFASAWQTSHSL